MSPRPHQLARLSGFSPLIIFFYPRRAYHSIFWISAYLVGGRIVTASEDPQNSRAASAAGEPSWLPVQAYGVYSAKAPGPSVGVSHVLAAFSMSRQSSMAERDRTSSCW